MQNTMILITTDSLGKGDRELGDRLMANYFRLLSQANTVPRIIFLIHKGVYLATAQSTVAEHMAVLESRGVDIISCQTCVDYYNIKSEIQVGLVSGMTDLLELMATNKVITLA